jgi:small basic protein (TIGR04137 family)
VTIHKSLRVKSRLVRRRNVLSREERIERLAKEERWKEGNSIYGLPKVKVVVKAPKKRAKAEKAAEAAEGAPVEAGAAAPADAAAAAPADKKAPAEKKAPARSEKGAKAAKGEKEQKS